MKKRLFIALAVCLGVSLAHAGDVMLTVNGDAKTVDTLTLEPFQTAELVSALGSGIPAIDLETPCCSS